MKTHFLKQPLECDDDFTETTASSSSFSSRRNSVSFGSVLIHFHPIVLSDNPAVREGLPIELAWTASHSELFHIDNFSFDEVKPTAGNVKRIVAEERKKWLTEKGFCENCFYQVSQEVEAIQRSRNEEIAMLKEHCKEQDVAAFNSYKLMSTVSYRASNREFRRSLLKTSNVGIVKQIETKKRRQLLAK